LTYDKQGPSETVISGKTGWLANADVDLFTLAVKIWKNRYESDMRNNCRQRALMFDVKKISEKWLKVLNDRCLLSGAFSKLEKRQFE